jgi:hypothetical protein
LPFRPMPKESEGMRGDAFPPTRWPAEQPNEN